MQERGAEGGREVGCSVAGVAGVAAMALAVLVVDE